MPPSKSSVSFPAPRSIFPVMSIASTGLMKAFPSISVSRVTPILSPVIETVSFPSPAKILPCISLPISLVKSSSWAPRSTLPMMLPVSVSLIESSPVARLIARSVGFVRSTVPEIINSVAIGGSPGRAFPSPIATPESEDMTAPSKTSISASTTAALPILVK